MGNSREFEYLTEKFAVEILKIGCDIIKIQILRLRFMQYFNQYIYLLIK